MLIRGGARKRFSAGRREIRKEKYFYFYFPTSIIFSNLPDSYIHYFSHDFTLSYIFQKINFIIFLLEKQLKRRKDGNPFMDDDALEEQLTQEWKEEDLSGLIDKEEKVNYNRNKLILIKTHMYSTEIALKFLASPYLMRFDFCFDNRMKMKTKKTLKCALEKNT